MKNLIEKLTHKILNETLEDKTNEVMEKLKFNRPGKSFDYVEEEETCEQCDSEMTEGETCECGGEMREGECMECGMKEGEVMEKLYGNQKKLDKAKPFGKLTKADFDKLRKEGDEVIYELEMDDEESEINESVLYSLEIDGEKTIMSESEFDQLVMSIVEKEESKNKTSETKYKLEIGGKGFIVSEEKLLDIIETAVLKEENNINKGKTPKGYGEYERSVKKSKKENDDYLKSVKKKMGDYLKDGSKGDYDMDPKFFPKGNGQLEKMKAKKYTMSDDGKEFLDDYMRPGMEIPMMEEGGKPEWLIEAQLKAQGYSGNALEQKLATMANGGEPNGGMALGQMAAVVDKMSKLRKFVSPDQNLDPWIASKLAVMDHSADAISDYMMYNPEAQGEGMEDMMAYGGVFAEGGEQDETQQSIMAALKQGMKPQEILKKLVAMGLTKEQAVAYIKSAVAHPGSQYDNTYVNESSYNQMSNGGEPQNAGFQALPDYVQEKIMDNMAEGGELDMYGGGGYVVKRSSARKGKTHVVIGPDGTKKYFGDSKLGQHPKDPERKKAFYARHKENLANNPYFRAYARATWEEGGEIEDQGGGMFKYGGIHLDPAKKGTFKASLLLILK